MEQKGFWFIRLDEDIREGAKICAVMDRKTVRVWISEVIRKELQACYVENR